MRRLAFVAFASLLAGCAGSPTRDYNLARDAYIASSDDYKECVREKGVASCQHEKAIMESDVQTYKAAARAITGGKS